MTEDQRSALRVAIEVLQSAGLIRHQRVQASDEARSLLEAAGYIHRREQAAIAGEIVFSLQDELELRDRLYRHTVFMRSPTASARAASETDAIIQQVVLAFLAELQDFGRLPPGHYVRIEVDGFPLTIQWTTR